MGWWAMGRAHLHGTRSLLLAWAGNKQALGPFFLAPPRRRREVAVTRRPPFFGRWWDGTLGSVPVWRLREAVTRHHRSRHREEASAHPASGPTRHRATHAPRKHAYGGPRALHGHLPPGLDRFFLSILLDTRY